MDDELHQLEAELKRLRPIAPSAELFRRIAGDLAPAQPRERRAGVPWFWAVTVPATAAALIVFSLGRRDAAMTPRRAEVSGVAAERAGEALKPVAVENVLYSAHDEGWVTLEDGTPARRERLNYVDTIIWKNPRTKASLTWNVPREEVRIVPVSFQ